MVSYQLHKLFASLNAMMDFRWRRSVMDRNPVRQGRVVLLGDAAHAPRQYWRRVLMLFPVELTHNLYFKIVAFQGIDRRTIHWTGMRQQAEISLHGSGSNGNIPPGRQPQQRYTD